MCGNKGTTSVLLFFLKSLISSMRTVTCFVAHVALPTQGDVTVTRLQTLCGQYLHFFAVPSSYLPRPRKEFRTAMTDRITAPQD